MKKVYRRSGWVMKKENRDNRGEKSILHLKAKVSEINCVTFDGDNRRVDKYLEYGDERAFKTGDHQESTIFSKHYETEQTDYHESDKTLT